MNMKNKGDCNCDCCGGSVRTLAASAGIQFGDLQTEAFRLREKLGPDHQKAYYEIIRQMASGGALSESEQRTLLELGKRGFGVGSDREAEKFVAYAQGLHKRMLAERGASRYRLPATKSRAIEPCVHGSENAQREHGVREAQAFHGRAEQPEQRKAQPKLLRAVIEGEHQRHAIERLAYGCATKVLVQRSGSLFGKRRARAFATDGAVGAFWDASEGEGEHASIVAFLAGGSTSASLRDKAVGDGSALLSELCWLGAATAPITAVHIADWTSDPWAGGGYAFLDPGFDPAWRPLLARRAGRMVFAGEHTSERWQGYMNGAVESGQRAAR